MSRLYHIGTRFTVLAHFYYCAFNLKQVRIVYSYKRSVERERAKSNLKTTLYPMYLTHQLRHAIRQLSTQRRVEYKTILYSVHINRAFVLEAAFTKVGMHAVFVGQNIFCFYK